MSEEQAVSHLSRLWLYAYGVLISLFLLTPILIVVPMSFSPGEFLEFPPKEFSLRWYRSFFDSAEWMSATLISLQAASLTALVATPLGTAAAYGLHVARSPLTRLFRPTLIIPLIVPVIIIAIGVFYLYARLGLVNTLTGLVLAHSVLALPFVVIVVGAGLQTYDMNQELVARSLGAVRWRAFMTVTLPLIRPSVISAALFAFISSFDEVVIALFVSRGPSSTLTRKMFTSLRDQVSPTIAAISTLLIVISILFFILILLVQSSQRKSAKL